MGTRVEGRSEETKDGQLGLGRTAEAMGLLIRVGFCHGLWWRLEVMQVTCTIRDGMGLQGGVILQLHRLTTKLR